MKLKATISIIVELLEKMMFMMNSMANFFLAALLFMRLLRMFFKLQSDFTDAGRKQIHYLKKTFTLLSCHDNDILLKKAISRIPNVSELFLKKLASLVVIPFPKDQNDKWTRA